MIPQGLLRTGVRDLVRRPLHTGLMVLGMALGVSVVVAIDIANVAARRASRAAPRPWRGEPPTRCGAAPRAFPRRCTESFASFTG